MSQRAAAGQGAPAECGRTRKPRYFPRRGEPTKGLKSAISEITHGTFNNGQNKFAAQFMQSQKNVTNYLQRTSAVEGYLVAETDRTGKNRRSTFPLPLTRAHLTLMIKDYLRRRGQEDCKEKAKIRGVPEEGVRHHIQSMLAGSQGQAGGDQRLTQRDQSLHKLISKIERICVGFDYHKQEVFNLVQALKTLFLYSQSDKETVEEYSRNFRSLWDTMEAFRGLPGTHKGITDGMLQDPDRVADVNRPTNEERRKAEKDGSEAVKAALLISGADKQRYGRLKNELANNYLLGTDQYPSNFNKALCILGNYQVSMSNRLFRMPRNESGLAFIQRGG
jgi:hypothetical protein